MSQSKHHAASKPSENSESVVAPEAAPAQETTSAEPADGTAVTEATQDQRRMVEAERDAYKERYVRLAAEYDNFRKRSTRERETLYAESKAETTAQFLSVFDNLERALAQPTEDEAYAQGVGMIQKGLLEVLDKLGVQKMEALGAAFDPNCHNAVMHVEDETHKQSTVVEVFSQGFVMGERVIRPAVVKVAN